MVSSNINSNRIIHDASSNEATNHLDLTNDYITSNGGGLQIVNYLPNEILHHHGQLLQGIKKLDASYMPTKDQNQLMHVYGDASSTIITSSSSSLQTSLPLLTPLKYVEYVATVNEDQMVIPNDDSDKSDCESINEMHRTPSKHVKRNLPHKKRITKKLNSSQPYNLEPQFSIMVQSEENNMRNVQASLVRPFDINVR